MNRSYLAPLMVLAALVSTTSHAEPTHIIDDFESVSAWSAHPADGVQLDLGSAPGAHGRALAMNFRFTGGGYAIARRQVDLDLPANYAFSFRIRGDSPVNTLEFKLIDSTNENVWWCVHRDFTFPKTWQPIVIKKRHIQFAWGPVNGGEIKHVAAIEIVVTASQGGGGTVWIDDFELRPLPATDATPATPVASASASAAGSEAGFTLDGNPQTAWQAPGGAAHAAITLDFQAMREYGGLTLQWQPGRHATEYVVESSENGAEWAIARHVRGANGGRDDLFLPESEARYVRLRVVKAASAAGIGLAEIVMRPLAWSASRNAFFQSIASDAARGLYPRATGGEQPYWTVVGVDNDTREALLDEDGRLETGIGRFAIEPFLFTAGRLITWHDAETEQTLSNGVLPIPTVRWCAGDLTLAVTALGVGAPESSSVVARYRITNHGSGQARGALFLAARPFQVNPPAQFLNTTGGFAPIRSLDVAGRTLRVNGEPAVVALTRPRAFGATTFDGGDIAADYLSAGRLPKATRVVDDLEAASGACEYPFDLAPGAERVVDILVPLHGKASMRLAAGARSPAWVDAQLERCRQAWDEKTGRVTIRLPESAGPVVETLRSQIGDILVNRAGPAIQPGTRSYARSWIRDGALTSTALLRCGHEQAVREFIEWFAPHQYPSGKIPCVVDHRGADPVPEHDSCGEFIYLVCEYYRFTNDRGLAERMFPRVLAAATYLDSLRQQRRTKEFQAPDTKHFFGLLPPSISHEGYSAKPMHSYWDDFWAVRGFRDAAFLAGELDHPAAQIQLEASATEFEEDVAASVQAAGIVHKIDYVPGCADLGDFDATSTTIALSPTGAAALLPRAVVERTFEKYNEFFTARRNGAPWDAFTPYEIRNLGAYVHLGWRDRAQDLLAYFLGTQRPTGWRQWPEVVWQDLRAPHFLGDLPHTWVGSDYIRSVLDMLAYERESDDALVVAAGVPTSWLRGSGVDVHDLRTRYGKLSYTLQSEQGAIVLHIDAGLRVPEGGIAIRAPLPTNAAHATIDGKPATANPDGEFIVRTLPATVTITPSR